MTRSINIPEPCQQLFSNGIKHPELYLWDAWSYKERDTYHLYCLAINRYLPNGAPLCAKQRNDYPFHIRHFTSENAGKHWQDEGVFHTPSEDLNGRELLYVWSGSIHPITPDFQLVAYTELQKLNDERPFLQSLVVGQVIHGCEFLKDSYQLLLCPVRDEKRIRECGYYLGEQKNLGNKYGEDNGPILAWRDPYCFRDTLSNNNPNALVMVWAAKFGAKQAALGMANLVMCNEGVSIDTLCVPTLLPDAHLYTQLELPKILVDLINERYLLLVATTTRATESQSDDEVEKCIRLYYASDIRGPWEMAGTKSSVIMGLDHQFGMTVLNFDSHAQKVLCIAPYTEAECSDKALTFAPCYEINLHNIGQVDELCASRLD